MTNSIITYTHETGKVLVYLDGRPVGKILQLEDKRWQYTPNNCKVGGDRYVSLAALKRDLEG